MAKSLTERIVDRKAREAQEASFTGEKNKATFLLHRDEVAKALADGWTIKTIYETLREENKVLYAYQTFRRLVRKLITDPNSATAKPSGTTEKLLPQPAPTHRPAAVGFTFNAAAKKEDLL